MITALFAFFICLAILKVAGRADERSEAMLRKAQQETLRPSVGETLMGQGTVIGHDRLIDSAGIFYGLCLLTVERLGPGYPDIDVWSKLLPANSTTYAVPDRAHEGRILIWYKLAGY